MEIELFRNLPIFKGNEIIIQNKSLQGKIIIKAQNKIINIIKELSMDNIQIIEDKYMNELKNNYLIPYKISDCKIGKFIQSSKIFLELDIEKDLIYSQKLSKESNEKIYILQYMNTYKQSKEINSFNPGLFMFLLQSKVVQ